MFLIKAEKRHEYRRKEKLQSSAVTFEVDENKRKSF